MSMNAMTYSKEVSQAAAGSRLSSEPLASDLLPKFQHPAAAPFQRPGPEVLSEAIPVFFIGRNRNGFWIARDVDGRFGGVFWSKEAAIRFARNIWPAGCATIFPQTRFELDIENGGNPLVSYIEITQRFLTRGLRRLTAVTRTLVRLGKRP
ncbi:hypothetical protein [Bradyrhizobium canariense]|nr:hypothetical protein [Bradyrhizobium canariense]